MRIRIGVAAVLLPAVLALSSCAFYNTGSVLEQALSRNNHLSRDDGEIRTNQSGEMQLVLDYESSENASNLGLADGIFSFLLVYPSSPWPGQSFNHYYRWPLIDGQTAFESEDALVAAVEAQGTGIRVQSAAGEAMLQPDSGADDVAGMGIKDGTSKDRRLYLRSMKEMDNGVCRFSIFGADLKSEYLFPDQRGRWIVAPIRVRRSPGDTLNNYFYGAIRLPFAVVSDVLGIVWYPFAWYGGLMAEASHSSGR